MLSFRKALGRFSMAAPKKSRKKRTANGNGNGNRYFGGYGYNYNDNPNMSGRSSKKIRMANRRTANMRRRMLALFAVGLFIIGFNFRFRHPNVSLSAFMLKTTAVARPASVHTNGHNNVHGNIIAKGYSDSDERAMVRAAAKVHVRETHLEAVKRNHAAATAANRNDNIGDIESLQACYRSKSSAASVCVYQGAGLGDGGLCVGAGGLVNLSRNNSNSKTGVQLRTEEVSELPVVSHELAVYIGKRKVLWYEPAIIVLHASSKCGSIVQFAKRIAIVYHILRHHRAYFGTNGKVKRIGVIIVAHPKVLSRLKYSRSWHRALIDALAYPGRPDLRRSAVLRFARSKFGGPPRVFVLPSFKAMSPDPRYRVAAHKWPVACFRRLAFGAASHTGFALEKAQYPEVTMNMRRKHKHMEIEMEQLDDDDNQALRKALFKAVLFKAAPPARRRLVYVHRGRNRSFGTGDLSRVERSLVSLAAVLGFSYTRLDSDGLPVSAVLAGLGDAGLVVGIHGTTLLSTQFLAKGAALVEIFPYRFVNELYSRRLTSDNVHYRSVQLSTGDDYVGSRDFATTEECQILSVRCRNWYRSDNRPLRFQAKDERALAEMVTQAATYVKAHTTKA